MARRTRQDAVLEEEPANASAPPPAPGRRRFPRPKPHEIGSLLPWSLRATCGDSILLLVPFVEVVALTLLVLAVGAPGEPEVLLPLMSLPPIDAYQDVGVVDLVTDSAVWTWVLRALFLVVRVYVFGTLVALAVDRARGRAPAVRAALQRVRERRPTIAFLELLSFGAFGSVLVLRSSLPGSRADDSVGAALVFGLLFLPTAFVAVVADGLPAGRAVRRSFLWIRRRPLGHLVLSVGYVAALNGLYRLAVAGAVGRPAAIATALLAFVAAFVAILFLTALVRRYDLLYSEVAVAEWMAARRATPRAPKALRAPGAWRKGKPERVPEPKAARGGEAAPAGEPEEEEQAIVPESPPKPPKAASRPDRPAWMDEPPPADAP